MRFLFLILWHVLWEDFCQLSIFNIIKPKTILKLRWSFWLFYLWKKLCNLIIWNIKDITFFRIFFFIYFLAFELKKVFLILLFGWAKSTFECFLYVLIIMFSTENLGKGKCLAFTIFYYLFIFFKLSLTSICNNH